jgi:predicted metal-dependent hydrolase
MVGAYGRVVDVSVERDRDELGRPRNARPRDALGRPLPRGEPGVQGVPEGLTLSPAETLREAQRLLDGGYPFQAHEVLEAAWKSAPPDERDLWQGLAQLAVGLTHALRGNAAGAAALLDRGADRLARYPDAPHHIDVSSLTGWARELTAALAPGRAVELSMPRLRRGDPADQPPPGAGTAPS